MQSGDADTVVRFYRQRRIRKADWLRCQGLKSPRPRSVAKRGADCRGYEATEHTGAGREFDITTISRRRDDIRNPGKRERAEIPVPIDQHSMHFILLDFPALRLLATLCTFALKKHKPHRAPAFRPFAAERSIREFWFRVAFEIVTARITDYPE